MRGDRDNSACFHVDGVLGFIGQCGAPILQFRDLCFAVARVTGRNLSFLSGAFPSD
jgi:hypothetical protein